jgi:hypothetical protein
MVKTVTIACFLLLLQLAVEVVEDLIKTLMLEAQEAEAVAL